MKRLLVMATAAALVLATALPAVAAPNNRGGNGNSPIVADHIWVDGELYDTLILGSLPYSERNAGSFNHIYPVFGPSGPAGGEVQLPVAPYAPGDVGYRGGRWVPEPVKWTQEAVDMGIVENIESVEELNTFVSDGYLVSLGEMPQGAFLCPLLPND